MIFVAAIFAIVIAIIVANVVGTVYVFRQIDGILKTCDSVAKKHGITTENEYVGDKGDQR